MAEDSAASGRRDGRRGNGLAAAAYVPLAELDPRLAEAMLEALREASVAAYVTPLTGTTSGSLEVSLPERPLVRLWVDSAARPQAAAIVAELSTAPGSAPESGQVAAVNDEEASWRAIVATFQTPTGTPTWPAAEEVPHDGPRSGRLVRGPGSDRVAGESASAPGEPEPYGDVEDLDDDSDADHYVPPVPPPVPQPHPVTRWAVLAMVLGFTVLVLPAVLGDAVGPGLALLAVAAIIGGFGTLVARMRDAPPTDSGPDDGAVV